MNAPTETIGLFTWLLIPILLLVGAACQPTLVREAALPTLMVLPTLAPSPSPTRTPTAADTATPAPSPSPTATLTFSAAATATAPPTLTLTPTPRPTLPAAFAYGKSVEGRDLLARSFGSGQRMVMLVGGIHTGYEANSVTLVNELIAHFERAPQDVLPGITLVLIPAANPDGLERGRSADGRFNARGVDLNRNWDCEWSPDAFWRQRSVDPGVEPFSEPEAIALAALIYDLRPAAVIFYHAAANGVYAGSCNGLSHSDELAAVLGAATGYPYGEMFAKYVVTGTESNWVDSLGIPAVDLELSTTTDTELVRNRSGVMAVQCWVLELAC